MGTSKGYIAPTTIKWAQAKRAVGSYLKNRDYDFRSYAVAKFSTAMRENVNSGTSSPFQSAAAGILGFAQGIASGGLDNALRDIGRDDLIGKEPTEIWNELVHEFTHAGATTEEALAAGALSAAWGNLQISDISELGTISSETLLKEFLKEYIISSFDFAFEERISKGLTPAETDEVLKNVHDFIRNTIDVDLKFDSIKSVNFTQLSSSDVVKEALDEALRFLERYYMEVS